MKLSKPQATLLDGLQCYKDTVIIYAPWMKRFLHLSPTCQPILSGASYTVNTRTVETLLRKGMIEYKEGHTYWGIDPAISVYGSEYLTITPAGRAALKEHCDA